MLSLSQIECAAPNVRGYGGGKWAMYSVGCCWWTTDPKAMGEREHNLPCCPHCGSVLMQAPLPKFLRSARNSPEHYGPGGLAAFAAAHSSNATMCRNSWELYGMSQGND
jgi:hypothetical protein